MIPARDWLQKPKYLQIMLKSTVERIIPITNKGTAIDRRTRGLICGSLIASAMVKRAARNAVSPEVIGRITTPKIASTPPKVPNKAYEEVEEYNGTLVHYSFLKESSGVPMVQKITMTVSTDTASTKFVYYEKAAGSAGFGM